MSTTLPDIRAHLTRVVGSTSHPEMANLVLDAVMEAMPQVLAQVRREERHGMVAELRRLSEGRMDYVGRKIEHAGDIDALTPLQATVYGEASGAAWLARILDPENDCDDKGWLPSWRWSR